MRKIFFISLTGYAIGIVLADVLYDIRIIIPLAILCVALCGVALWKNISYGWVFFCVFLVAGIFYCNHISQNHIENVEYINRFRKSVVLFVRNNPFSKGDRTTFNAVAMKDGRKIATLSVSVSGDGHQNIKYGDIIFVDDMQVTIPYEGYNRGDMDYDKYLKSHGVSGLVYADTEDVSIFGNDGNEIIRGIYFLSDFTKDAIMRYIQGDEGGFSVALLTGDKNYISQDTYLDIEVSGLSHVVAVSGMHMNIFIMLVYVLFSRSRKRSYTATFVNILLCIFMVIFTGGSYSVIRAAMMVILANIGYFLGRGTYSLNSVICVGGIIIVVNPYALFDMSFILSFAATLSIILFEEKTEDFIEKKACIKNKYFKSLISVTLSAQYLVFPCIIAMKNTVNTYSLLSNVLVSPIIPFYMLSVIFLVVFSGIGLIADFVKYITFIMAKYVLKVCDTISVMPYSEIVVSDFMFSVFIVLSILSVYLYYLLRLNRFKYRGIIINIWTLSVIILLTIPVLFPLNTYIDFINVGQGDSTLIRDKGVNILIDSGGSKRLDSDFGNRVVGAYLKRKGVKRIDYAFITHYDTDHCQGMISLLDYFDIERIIGPPPSGKEDAILHNAIITKAREKGTEIIYTKYGDKYVIREGSILMIVAPEKYSGDNSNADSLMIMYDCDGVKTLFAGDNSNEENVKRYDADADILKVGHHGAVDSNSKEFIRRVSPVISVISVGENNIYSHPHSEVLKILYKSGSIVMRTDYDGAVSVRIKNGKIKVKTSG